MSAVMHRSMSIVIATAGISKQNTAIHGMQAQLSQYQDRDNIPMFALHGVISRPLPGAKLAVVFGGGDPSKALCLGVNDPRYHLQGLADGVVGLAHHPGGSVLFHGDRIEVQAAGKPVLIANAGAVTITTSSKVRIEGDLEVTGEITARADGAAVHLTAHVHDDPQGGSVGKPHG